jgi:hypothetical protein
VEVAADQRIGVVHIPKCGGSAVLAAVRTIEGAYTAPGYIDHAHRGSARLSADIPADRASWVVSPDQLAEIVAHHRIVMGHYAASSLVDAGCTELAVQLREPRARLLSKYRFWQSRSDAERAADGLWGQEFVATADRPLDEFLSNRATWTATRNRITSKTLLAASSPPWASARRRIARRAERTAPYLSVVEWSTDSQRFVDRLCERLGRAESITVGRVNETQLSGERQVVDAGTLRLLDELTSDDSFLLSWLMDAGLLARRSAAQLDEEFAQACERLNFELRP